MRLSACIKWRYVRTRNVIEYVYNFVGDILLITHVHTRIDSAIILSTYSIYVLWPSRVLCGCVTAWHISWKSAEQL